MVKLALGSRAQPDVPVQTFGHRLGFLGPFNSLRPEGTRGPVVHFANRSDGAVPNPLAKQAGGFRSLVADGNLGRHARFARHFGDPPRFIDRVSERFLAENVFALFHRRRGNDGVQIVCAADNNGIHVLLFFEQFAVITVGSAAVVFSGGLSRSVISVHNLLAGFAAGDATCDFQGVCQLNGLIGAQPIPAGVPAEQVPDRFTEFVSVPLGIISACFVGVADGHTLDVGLFQEAEHDAQALGAHADESDIDSIARRKVAGAT